MFPRNFSATYVFSHPVPITQMFQSPAVIAMSITATRMHRSLTDFGHSGYHPHPLLHFALTLTAVDDAGLRIAIQLLGSRRRIRIQVGNSQRQFRSTGGRWPCTCLPGTVRQPRRAKMRCIAHTFSRSTRASAATLRME